MTLREVQALATVKHHPKSAADPKAIAKLAQRGLISYRKREGYHLTAKGEDAYQDWLKKHSPHHEDIELPACAASMGCLCAGHARGNPARDACDTSEQP